MKAAGYAALAAALAMLVHATLALAASDLGALSAALPPAAAPGLGFASGSAPGWSFPQADFVDGGYRDPEPDVPSLHGYDGSFAAPPLAIGTLADVSAVVPRRLSRDEAIASLDVAHGGFDAATLGVFDIANAQSFVNQSITVGGGEFGRHFTFRFAGQVGSDNDD